MIGKKWRKELVLTTERKENQ